MIFIEVLLKKWQDGTNSNKGKKETIGGKEKEENAPSIEKVPCVRALYYFVPLFMYAASVMLSSFEVLVLLL